MGEWEERGRERNRGEGVCMRKWSKIAGEKE